MGVSTFHFAVLLCGGAAVAGCQSYRAEPFDGIAFNQAWRERGIDEPSVGTIAEHGSRSRPTTSPAVSFDVRDGLTLSEAQAVALIYNPALRLARMKAGVTKATADNAGRWSDPSLGVNAERIVSGVDDPWVVGRTINLTLPLSGRLQAEKSRAKAEHFSELVRVAGQEWSTRHRLTRAWGEWSMQAARVELLNALVARLDAMNRVTDRLADAGSLTRIEARLFRIERATRRAEQSAAITRLAESRFQLNAILGLVPDAAVTLVPEVAIEPTPAPIGRLAERNYEVRVAAAEYETAERTLQREVRAQYPDLVIGPGFGTDEGDERVLLGLTLPLSLWNRNRQGVAEARAGRDVARVALETTIEAQTSMLVIARVQLDAAVRQRKLLESEIVPAVDEQAAEAGKLAELGEVNAVLLLDAFVRQHESRLRLLDARLTEVEAGSRLAELAGNGSGDVDVGAIPRVETKGFR